MNPDNKNKNEVSDDAIMCIFFAGVAAGMMLYHLIFVEHLFWIW